MPKRFFITKSIDILEFESVSEWGYPRHKHNFFELTLIIRGAGQHILNESIIDYKEGDVFFLTPKDEHEFVVAEPTVFALIKFTEQIFLEKTEILKDSDWQKRLDAIIFHSNAIPESIVKNASEGEQYFRLFNMIKPEFENLSVYSHPILMELFGALLILISRSLNLTPGVLAQNIISEQDKVNAILAYIRQNVLHREEMKVAKIADVFHMSPNYISIFIKKHAGISIQQYVIQTKMKMAERFLKQTNLNISEIVQKLGFVDSSHFNRTFKKYVGKNPSEFR